LTGVKATSLVKNSAGEVVRVRAESKTTNFVFNVIKGVVIATGGFDNDHDGLMAEHNPDSKDFASRSSRGNVGEGIKMGVAIGAKTIFKGGKMGIAVIDATIDYDITSGTDVIYALPGGDLGFIDLTAPASEQITDADGSPLTLAPVQWGDSTHDLVDGEECKDPSVIFTGMMRVLKENEYAQFFQISDTPFPGKGNITHVYLYSRHLAFNSNDFFELGDQMSHGSMDPAKLEACYAARGWVDLPDGYYAWTVQPSSLGSMGGLKINSNAQVLGTGAAGTVTTNNVAIPGLFAAGEVANGDFYYQQYPAPGSSLAIALTLGRIAGENAAKAGPHTLLE